MRFSKPDSNQIGSENRRSTSNGIRGTLGETDNVYLTHAVRSLAVEFHELATVGADGKVVLAVRLYKYRQSSTARITGLRGGASVLANFVVTYKEDVGRFSAAADKHPVIIVYDNDSGAKKLKSVLKDNFGKHVKGTEPFVHVFRNLYAIPTPLLNGAQTSMNEDFFEAKAKATTVDGKTFHDEDSFDTTMHYGKKVFAHRVVVPGAKTINFEGFKPLLGNIVAVIKAHATKVSKAPAHVGP